MLGDFVRLTDYVAVEALVNLAIKTNATFLTELLKPRKAGLFETTVFFTDEGTAFTPTCEDIKVCRVFFECLSLFDDAPRDHKLLWPFALAQQA